MVFIRLSFHHHVWKIWQGTELIPFFSSSTLNTSFCILLISIISNEKLAVTIVLLYVMCHFPLATFKTFALLKFNSFPLIVPKSGFLYVTHGSWNFLSL